MYKRSEYQVIMNRLKEQRKFIQVVMGTRQIGKPTVIKQVLKDSDMKKQITTYFIGILVLAMLCSGCSTNRMAAGDPARRWPEHPSEEMWRRYRRPPIGESNRG